ncbi:SinI family restriction endonuclease [Clostridium senegalense]|uniref:SinI family restriction endonuclease n=1 Tax=Clostridium senegalense TaxID=1465809 RepID=A0A6M0H4U1_9CLOT|nr:SinI family restriction endonuclease [Clostridium senegalense]NEU05284.1 SinI family restriction endonuclease [Clostridium senegalense]
MSTLNSFAHFNNEVYVFLQNTSNINPEIRIIFNLNMLHKNLFPNINLGRNATWQKYILSWIKKYDDADKIPPSMRIGTPSKSPYDSVTNIIVKESLNLDNNSITAIQQYHTLCMQSENIQGGLLEEYIYSKVKKCDWICCK